MNEMIDILKEQYRLVKSSREVVFEFIDTRVGKDLNTAVAAFEDKTIRYLLVHTANTYVHWLHNFALQKQAEFADDREFTYIEGIKKLYEDADKVMDTFLAVFSGRLDEVIGGTLSGNRVVRATPLQLFTHVITHEFHHKGQIMTMCRLLGYPPPDTDIIRF